MKQLSDSRIVSGDQTVDALLRAHAKNRPAQDADCPGFDPDLANAFIEGALNENERARYQVHISECSPCRSATAALVRLAAADMPAARAAVVSEGRPSVLARLRRSFGALSAPQWALAATALIAIAIALPLLLSRSLLDSRSKTAARSVASPALSAESSKNTESTPALQAESRSDHQAEELTSASFDNAKSANVATRSVPGHEPTGIAGGFAGPVYNNTKKLTDSESVSGLVAKAEPPAAPVEKLPLKDQPIDSVAGARARENLKDASNAARESAAAQTQNTQVQQNQAQSSELARIDEKQAQRLPQEDKDSAQVTVLKQGRADADQRQTKEATIRPEDAIAPAPPPSSSNDVRAKRRLAQAPRLAIRDGSIPEATRPKPVAEKKINGKKFWLRDNVWTDKDYNPEREMPIVTIVRDSDVYRELLSKRSGLKPYFTGFGDHDRAIIVYKGTVYRLIPQN